MSECDFNIHCADDLFPFIKIDNGDAPIEQQFASLLTRINHCLSLSQQLYSLFGSMADRGGSAELVRQGDSLAYALVTILGEFDQEITELESKVNRECRK